MIFKKPIYRILFFAAWIVLPGGIITLLIAANRKNKEHVCKGVTISINAGGDKIFVEKDDVLKSMERTAKGPLVNKQCGNINLSLLEKTLEKSSWIRDAELYFDTKDTLHVSVLERVPVARVFTTAGASFYMDSAGYQMPLLSTYSARLPVVTGFINAKKLSAKDSALVQEIKKVVKAINADVFWSAQIGQIDITANRKFELIPTIGDAVIKLGDAFNIEDKLKRLMVFYKQVLPKVGFTKYIALDVQFDGQVVAVKKGPQWVIDSIQLQKNIQELMRKKAAEQEAEGIEPEQNMKVPLLPVTKQKNDSIQIISIDKKDEPDIEKKISNPPTPTKNADQKSIPIANGMVKQNPEKLKQQKPKAVMQKRNGY